MSPHINHLWVGCTHHYSLHSFIMFTRIKAFDLLHPILKGNGKEDWCLQNVDLEEDAEGGVDRKENERVDTARLGLSLLQARYEGRLSGGDVGVQRRKEEEGTAEVKVDGGDSGTGVRGRCWLWRSLGFNASRTGPNPDKTDSPPLLWRSTYHWPKIHSVLLK